MSNYSRARAPRLFAVKKKQQQGQKSYSRDKISRQHKVNSPMEKTNQAIFLLIKCSDFLDTFYRLNGTPHL